MKAKRLEGRMLGTGLDAWDEMAWDKHVGLSMNRVNRRQGFFGNARAYNTIMLCFSSGGQ